MRPLKRKSSARAAAVGLAVAVAFAGGEAAAADDKDALPAAPTKLRMESVYAPAAGLEAGAGVVWPSVAATFAAITGQLGASFRLPAAPVPWLFQTLYVAVGAESGVGIALSGTTPTYGYVLRLPMRGFADLIFSRYIEYREARAVNLHFGGSGGSDFVLASQCSGGTCSYLPPANYGAFGLRVGISLTDHASGIGAFMRWDSEVAGHQGPGAGGCTGGSGCNPYFQIFTWNIGWTLF
jgi:hypothetical protein